MSLWVRHFQLLCTIWRYSCVIDKILIVWTCHRVTCSNWTEIILGIWSKNEAREALQWKLSLINILCSIFSIKGVQPFDISRMKMSPVSSDGTLWSVDHNSDNVYSGRITQMYMWRRCRAQRYAWIIKRDGYCHIHMECRGSMFVQQEWNVIKHTRDGNQSYIGPYLQHIAGFFWEALVLVARTFGWPALTVCDISKHGT